MSDIAIRVEHLSKQYRIGGSQAPYQTLRETIVGAVRKPLKVLSGESKVGPEKIWALNDVSFEIKRGEVVGVIGRNGAGKSTLLKILSHITSPTKGRVEIHGRVGSLLEVGTGFHNELTGRENIYLNGAILGMTRAEIARKFDEIVDFAEIEKFLDTPVKHYSSGMYMRLAFAVAAHLEPEILLVDEVLAVGDAEFQKKCLGKMGEVAHKGRAVLFVSHNIAAVLNLCSRGMLFEKGQLLFDANIKNVVERYLTDNQNIKSVYEFKTTLLEKQNGFNFISVSILRPGTNKISSEVSLVEGFDVEIKYEISKPIKNANIAFHLYNGLGSCIFSSTDVDSDINLFEKLREKGIYVSRVFISKDFLRAGKYVVGVSASIPNRKILGDYKFLMSINVIDTGSVEETIGQGREGIISPVIKWRTKKL